MKAHRWTVFLSILLSITSLFFAFCFSFSYIKLESNVSDFLSSLLLGVFASGLIVATTTLLSYLDLKEKSRNTLISRIIKTQTHYEDVRILVNPRNISTYNGEIPALSEEKLFREVKELITNILWTPRSERISWYTSALKPPNSIFSTHLQKVEFEYTKTCSDLFKLCYAYWDCYCKSQRNATGELVVNSHFESGCRTELVRFFYREVDFISYSNVYLDLVKKK